MKQNDAPNFCTLNNCDSNWDFQSIRRYRLHMLIFASVMNYLCIDIARTKQAPIFFSVRKSKTDIHSEDKFQKLYFIQCIVNAQGAIRVVHRHIQFQNHLIHVCFSWLVLVLAGFLVILFGAYDRYVRMCMCMHKSWPTGRWISICVHTQHWWSIYFDRMKDEK